MEEKNKLIKTEEDYSLKFKASRLRKALFPFKVISFLLMIITPIFFFISIFSNLLSKLDKDLSFALKMGIFLSFCFLNFMCKLLQGIITYREIRHMYCKNKFTIKAYDPKYQKNEKGEFVKDKNGEDKRLDESPITYKKDPIKFSSETKSKYCKLTSASILLSILFVTPYITLTILERSQNTITRNFLNLEPYKSVSNTFYMICLTALLLTFLMMHYIQISMIIQKKVCAPLDCSPKNQSLLLCSLFNINQIIEYITITSLYGNSIYKYNNKTNQESEIDNQIETIMARNFCLSNSLYFSNGVEINNRFGLMIESNEKNEKAQSKHEICPFMFNSAGAQNYNKNEEKIR